MRPSHLDLMHAAGRPALTPDGSLAVVAVTRPDVTTDTYRGGLWAVPTDGSAARRLTLGPRDSAPAVSPDGRRVAFLRAGDGTPPQVHLTDLGGGEPLCLTDQPAGAGAPAWSPDGTRLLWSARVPEQGRYGTEDERGEKVGPEAEPPRLVTELAYRVDDVGYTRDRRRHVFVLDVPALDGGPASELPDLPLTPRQLTDGDADDTDPVWSPDGSLVAFVSARHETREDDLRSAAYAVPADATTPVSDPTAVTGGDVSLSGVRFLPDGRLVAGGAEVGPSGRDFVGRPTRLWVTDEPVTGTTGVRTLRPLTSEAHDLDSGAAGILVAGDRVLVQDVHRGGVRLLSVDPAGTADPEVVVDHRVVVTGQAASADAGTLVVSAGATDRVGDLAVVRDGALHWLTDLSARLRAEAGLVAPQEVEADSEGHPVHGWVVLPDAAQHGEGPHPVLLLIHGGPYSQYDAAVFDEAQVYAGAGYAVVMCNPRGSAGYGPDHGRAVHHAMGTVDADDVLAFLDHCLADPAFSGRLDADRVGVMGGSYGGYMTATLTTRTDRFVGAIVERGYLDGVSFVGSSDIGWFFPGEYHGSGDALAAQTPMSMVEKVTTPTLVIHSEADWRCPVEQGQRWYAALRMRGVPAELLLFPGEGHELSRSGRPRHRLQRFEHVLRWWGRHLPVG